eukprot:XP_013966024.2 LOW QUALITY PROTEIN: uncharacterized protein LOC100687109 [Canis lupus familiaris]
MRKALQMHGGIVTCLGPMRAEPALRTQIDGKKRQVAAMFEMLRQELVEQQDVLVAQLRELELQIWQERDEYISEVSEEVTRLRAKAKELEKCQQPASALLQDVRVNQSRYETKTFVSPEFISSDLIKKIRDLHRKVLLLPEMLRTFSENPAHHLETDSEPRGDLVITQIESGGCEAVRHPAFPTHSSQAPAAGPRAALWEASLAAQQQRPMNSGAPSTRCAFACRHIAPLPLSSSRGRSVLRTLRPPGQAWASPRTEDRMLARFTRDQERPHSPLHSEHALEAWGFPGCPLGHHQGQVQVQVQVQPGWGLG